MEDDEVFFDIIGATAILIWAILYAPIIIGYRHFEKKLDKQRRMRNGNT